MSFFKLWRKTLLVLYIYFLGHELGGVHYGDSVLDLVLASISHSFFYSHYTFLNAHPKVKGRVNCAILKKVRQTLNRASIFLGGQKTCTDMESWWEVFSRLSKQFLHSCGQDYVIYIHYANLANTHDFSLFHHIHIFFFPMVFGNRSIVCVRMFRLLLGD